MKKKLTVALCLLLSVCLLLPTTLSVSANDTQQELYLSELRLIYADTYEKAREKLDKTAFSEYTLLDRNLNAGTGKGGVWLAYLTSPDVEDAITDIAAIQMGGGYREGNYREMLKQSQKEYLAMGRLYEQAIAHMIAGYDAGNFLSECAYRQLNFYLDGDSDTLLGDLMMQQIGADGLATIFMEGNVYALANIRDLIAMGVSYNESGLTYLEQVAEQAALMEGADASVFEDADNFEDFPDLALIIANVLPTIREFFDELALVEDEFNYDDEEMTETELAHVEHYAVATLFRDTPYLDGKTLYDFVLNYEYDEDEDALALLYPLVAALNEGQAAMAQLGEYYSVIRYSISTLPEEEMIADIDEMALTYDETPFDVYTGVDRSVFNGTFAMTSEAYRGDNISDKSFADAIYNKDTALLRGLEIGAATAGVAMLAWAASRSISVYLTTKQTLARGLDKLLNERLANSSFFNAGFQTELPGIDPSTTGEVMDLIWNNYGPATPGVPFSEQVSLFQKGLNDGTYQLGELEMIDFENISEGVANVKTQVAQSYNDCKARVYENMLGGAALTTALYVLSAVAMTYAAIQYLVSIYNYRHPDYDDIPVAMVDLVETANGDRYIKYDAVLEAEPTEDGEYCPGDVNAFEAQRWNALYYTKSYEAGDPLLATFDFSNNNHTPKDGYRAVHRFGESLCYNLNKHNFSQKSPSIYLSIKQSENQKSAVTDVPDVVGAFFGSGTYLICTVLGAGLGVGGVLGLQAITKKKKSPADAAGKQA